MISSDPDESGWTHANEDLILPRNWPAAFKQNKTLSNFLNNTIKATKARLIATTLADDIATAVKQAAQSLPSRFNPADNAANADRVHAALGWPVLRGFAIFELEGSPNIFVARRHSWNAGPRNVWVDLTPRPKHHAEVGILLVEADVNAAYVRAGLPPPPPQRSAVPAPPSSAASSSFDAGSTTTSSTLPAPAAVASSSAPSMPLTDVPKDSTAAVPPAEIS